ncbi:MAG: hypothetical protein HZY76_08150 [Anaerolineae bacterium]|nr:MAG: hypothetical protein HZY76_08150 [Anaerolineae bacterium]
MSAKVCQSRAELLEQRQAVLEGDGRNLQFVQVSVRGAEVEEGLGLTQAVVLRDEQGVRGGSSAGLHHTAHDTGR